MCCSSHVETNQQRGCSLPALQQGEKETLQAGRKSQLFFKQLAEQIADFQGASGEHEALSPQLWLKPPLVPFQFHFP